MSVKTSTHIAGCPAGTDKSEDCCCGMVPERAGRAGDSQPLPVPNDAPDVQSAVIADIEHRREVGIARYGTALQPHNGRDALLDLYEELLDAACYAKQRLLEDGGDLHDVALASAGRLLDERDAEIGRLRDLLRTIVGGFTEHGSIGGVNNVRRHGWVNSLLVATWQSSIDRAGS